jgi:hypothetical protein
MKDLEIDMNVMHEGMSNDYRMHDHGAKTPRQPRQTSRIDENRSANARKSA